MAIQQVNDINAAFPTRRQGFYRFVNSFGFHVGKFLLNYWAHMIAFVLSLIVLAALLVPFLSYFGLDAIAKPIFYALHYVCAQVPSHSFYILGHQLGLCARNLSIYAS